MDNHPAHTVGPDADAVTLADIEDAAERLQGVAVRTPLLRSPLLDRRAGRPILVKAEALQRTGSFKLRGAYNRIAHIAPEARQRGVVAYSSGNHAQGVAAAAGLLGLSATIVMPSDAPAIKRANTEALGASVVLYDRQTESREAIGARIRDETAATLVRPYDDPLIIAGQGTVGLELIEQCELAGVTPAAVLVPCGGGGLSAGIATAVAAKAPGTPVFCVEPEGYDDTRRSLESGHREQVVGHQPTACDALMSPQPGEITFAINRQQLRAGLVVREDQVLQAMAAAFLDLKIVVEPGGAVALAAALWGDAGLPPPPAPLVVVCSGGNVDPQAFATMLSAAPI